MRRSQSWKAMAAMAMMLIVIMVVVKTEVATKIQKTMPVATLNPGMGDHLVTAQFGSPSLESLPS